MSDLYVKGNFRCEDCDYSSVRKGDLARHRSRRHPEAREEEAASTCAKRASASKGQRTPPTVERKNCDWPSLSEILGSHSTKDLGELQESNQNPPTPYVTPERRPENEEGDRVETEDNKKSAPEDRQQPGPHNQAGPSDSQNLSALEQSSVTSCDTGENSRESARHDLCVEAANGGKTAEGVVRRAIADSGRIMPVTEGRRLKERISTVVLPDGRVFVTRENFN
ncbi:hypothetical protein HOLleu_00779 [Holothuria leucospilota]|uniref:C2H2-type domain-containing protein n=1 Tax=Holothuria leucospilota TaxID=206669 RepID=A0A9Q1CQ43_HOLLE|nr:hypothetical protein HOLleu_00779 [Holothuria leucospilota]